MPLQLLNAAKYASKFGPTIALLAGSSKKFGGSVALYVMF